MQASDDLLEGADSVLQRNELALVTSEDLCDLERLRHETLNLTRALDLIRFVRIATYVSRGAYAYRELVLLR